MTAARACVCVAQGPAQGKDSGRGCMHASEAGHGPARCPGPARCFPLAQHESATAPPPQPNYPRSLLPLHCAALPLPSNARPPPPPPSCHTCACSVPPSPLRPRALNSASSSSLASSSSSFSAGRAGSGGATAIRGASRQAGGNRESRGQQTKGAQAQGTATRGNQHCLLPHRTHPAPRAAPR